MTFHSALHVLWLQHLPCSDTIAQLVFIQVCRCVHRPLDQIHLFDQDMTLSNCFLTIQQPSHLCKRPCNLRCPVTFFEEHVRSHELPEINVYFLWASSSGRPGKGVIKEVHNSSNQWFVSLHFCLSITHVIVCSFDCFWDMWEVEGLFNWFPNKKTLVLE